MKKLYVIIIFLVFFNLVMFMFGSLNLFKVDYSGDESGFGVDKDGNVVGGGESVFENLSGADFTDLLGLFFVDLSDAGNFLSSLAILGVAALAAWITKSPAPFVVGFIGNIMKNIYVNSIGVFENLPGINEWMMLIGLVGMVLLFIITCAETLTHGEV